MILSKRRERSIGKEGRKGGREESGNEGGSKI